MKVNMELEQDDARFLYDQLIRHVEAIQIEMCQRIYMNEAQPRGAPGLPRFGQARTLLRDVFTALADAIRRRQA